MPRYKPSPVCIILSVVIVFVCDQAVMAQEKQGAWPFEITAVQRPGTIWWCPGSAWDAESIDWNLENLKAGGIGTAHIVPIYGAKGYEDRYIPFLSDEWIVSLRYILRKAQSLGMQVDMTTGTGWCFGGPDLAPDHRDTRARLDGQTGALSFSTRRMVKRAAPGGRGHMMNPFSQGAMTAYLNRFDPALSGLDLLPRGQYHDSYEYTGNWCAELPDAFAQRRGYDLRDHLQTLFGEVDNAEKAGRIKYDYRLTAAELHREFIETWTRWANSRDMVTREQAHGAPANLLDVYAAADIPETEMFGSPEFPIPGFRHDERFTREGDSDLRICRMASSAAHVAHPPGRQLVSSESCTWMREHWHGTLGQIKLEMDLFFLAGINHVFYHGTCYSAKDAPWPGWFFYASTKADWRNSIWRDMPFLNAYLARCQSVLQAGIPANDILVYWPIHDLWMDPQGGLQHLTVHQRDWMDHHRIGEMASLLDGEGYTYDFVSDRMLTSIAYRDGALVAPGGTYRVIVVPACAYMPPETLKHLGHLGQQGAQVIFERALPRDVPGLSALDERRASFRAEKERLGRVVVTDDVPSALKRSGVKRESMVEHGLRFIRRRIDDGCWYFIANHTAKDYAGWLELASPCTSVTLHDPMTGDSSSLPTRVEEDRPQVFLDISAGESLILHASHAHPKAKPILPLKAAGAAKTLAGRWQVEFIEGGPALPASYATESLTCWTQASDERTQAFAGTARYTLAFTLPEHTEADDYMLDLGDVRESARIRINGRDVATLFALPMRVEVGRFLKTGTNHLEVEVTNLAANRIRDLEIRQVDWKIMHDANIVTPAYRPFDGSKWPLQPSGLLGPVTLTPMIRMPLSALE